MAIAITPLVSTPSTNNVTAYVSGNFTPAANSLLVAFVSSTAVGTGTMTGGGLTWTSKGSATWATNVGTAQIFTAPVGGTSPGSIAATFTKGVAGTGCIIQIFGVTGYNTAATDPVRQIVFTSTTAANAPIVFAGNTLGDSGIIFCVTAARNPIGASLSTNATPGFTLPYDTGYATPTAGQAATYRNSGINGNQYGLIYAAITAMSFGVEIAAPIVTSPVRYIRDWENGSDLASGSYWAEVNGFDEFGTSLGPTSTYTFSGPTNPTPPTTSYLYNHIYDNTSGVEVPAAGLNNVVMDFGSLVALSQIQILRYPSGTFNGTKTEVSPDGVTWYTAYDSAVSGTYVEGGFGRMFSVPVYTISVGTTYNDNVSEAATATDAETTSLQIASSSTEALTGAETMSVSGVSNAVQTDTAASVESINSTVARPGAVSEPNTASDSSSNIITGLVAISEAATAAETRSVTFVAPVAISEPVTPTDTEAASAVFTAANTEALSPAEVVGYIQTSATSVTEAGSLDHSQATTVATNAASTEPVTVAETVAAGTTPPDGVVIEPLSPTESQSTSTLFAASGTADGALSDTINRATTVVGAISEAVSTVDTSSNLRTTVAAISESGPVTEAATSAAILGAIIAEAANNAEISNIGSTSSALTLEFASATGNGAATFNVFATGTDAANPSDTGNGVTISAGLNAVFEPLTPTESSSTLVNLNAVATESNISTDSAFARVDYFASVSELANLREIIFLNFLGEEHIHSQYPLVGRSIVYPATGKARNYPLYGKK